MVPLHRVQLIDPAGGERSGDDVVMSPASGCADMATMYDGGALTLMTIRLDELVDTARAAGLDGSDRGAVRRLIWAELGSDAVDHDVIDRVVERLTEAVS
jgi:hypothetical protein